MKNLLMTNYKTTKKQSAKGQDKRRRGSYAGAAQST